MTARPVFADSDDAPASRIAGTKPLFRDEPSAVGAVGAVDADGTDVIDESAVAQNGGVSALGSADATLGVEGVDAEFEDDEEYEDDDEEFEDDDEEFEYSDEADEKYAESILGNGLLVLNAAELNLVNGYR